MCNIWYCACTSAFWGWCALYFEKRDNCHRRDQKIGSFKMLRLPKAWRVYSQLSSSETNLLSEVSDAQEGGARLTARPGTRGLCSAGSEATGAATGAPLSPAGRDTGWRAGGAPARPGRCPVLGRPEAAVTALRPPREAGALVPRARPKRQTRLFWVFLWLAREGGCRLFPPSASSAHRFSPGAPEGVGRGPALHSPGHTGTVRGAGAAPPKRQPEG